MSINVCNDRSMASITSLPSGVSGSSLVLLSTTTASSSATVDITSDIDSTYKEYQVHFFDVHPESGSRLAFQVDTGTNTNYNQTITSSAFVTRHTEDDSTADLGYNTGDDLAQSTSFQDIAFNSNVDNYSSLSGSLMIFNPSSTTFVKHFISTINDEAQTSGEQGLSQVNHVAGYMNTTSAVDAIRFQFSSGNMDTGKIKLYGIKDS